MMLVWVAAWVAAAAALTYNDLDTSQILIDSLGTEELDKEFRSRLEALQTYIDHRYEIYLGQHEKTLQTLSRQRRKSFVEPSHEYYYQPTLPTLAPDDYLAIPSLVPDYWHSYTFNTINEREMVEVKSVNVRSSLGSLDITHVFHLNLHQFPAICRSDVGWGVLPQRGQMETVKVRSPWTATLTGCLCDLDNSKNCACCSPGGCLCKQADGHSGVTCVECGLESSVSACQAANWRPLELDAAVGLQYHLDDVAETGGLQQVLVSAKGNTISFFKIDAEGLQLIKTVGASKRVTHLGYGELFVSFYGSFRKRRFLVIFYAGEEVHEYREVTVNTKENTLSVGLTMPWESSGSAMRTWEVTGRLMVGVLKHANLLLYELKEDAWQEFHMGLVQTVVCVEEIKSFTTYVWGLEHVLLVVTHSLSRIYVLSGVQYETIQEFYPSHGLPYFQAFLPVRVPTCRNEVVLLTGHEKNLIVLAWNGTARAAQVIYTTTLDISVVNWEIGFVDLGTGDQSAQVVVHGTNGVTTLSVRATLVPLKDPILMQNRLLHDTMTSLQEEYARQAKEVEAAAGKLADSLDCGEGGGQGSGPVLLTGSLTLLHGVDVSGAFNTSGLEASSMGLRGTELDGASYTTYRDQLRALAHYSDMLYQLHTMLITIASTLDDAVPAQGSSRVVGGVKTVRAAGLHLDTLTVYSLDVDHSLDGSGASVHLEKNINSVVKRIDLRKITGRKTFNTLLVNTLDTPYLDDVPVNDLVTTTGYQNIAGATFSTLVAYSIVMTDGSTVAGIDFSEDLMLLSDDIVLGHATFTKGLTGDRVQVMTNMASGVDLDRLYRNTLRVSGGTVLGTLYFLSKVTVGSLKATEMMGVNVEDFMATTVFKNRGVKMNGKLTVPSTVHINGDLTVTGNINGESFPAHFPVRTDTALNFGPKRFSKVQFGSMMVDAGGTVDGLDISRMVTLNTKQHLTGRKIFTHGIDIKGNLGIATSIIDGVNLDLLTKGLSLSELTAWKFNVEFKKSVQAPSLQCRGKVNGIDFAHLAADIIYTDESSVVLMSGRKYFASALTVSDATFINTFNGEKFDDLVTTTGVYIFSGEVVLKNDVYFESLTVTGSVDGVDVDHLAASAFYLDKEGQVVRGRLTFSKTVTAGGLDVNGKINNLDFSNVVTKSGNQNFSSPQILGSATFSAVKTYAINMFEGYTVNSIDISQLAKRRVKLNSPEDFNGVLNVEGTVTVLGFLSAVYINNYDIQQLKDNLVTDDVSSSLSGNLIFSQLHVELSVTTTNMVGANGINISDISVHAVKLSSDNYLRGYITWGDLVMLRDVLVGGLVNGIDLVQLSADAVYKDMSTLQFITGKKTFQSGFSVRGDISAQTTNGIDLATQLFTLHTDQVISAAYNFYNLFAEQYVHLIGRYCDVDLKKLMSNTLRRRDDFLIGNVNFHDLVNITELLLGDSLNSVNVVDRLRDAVRLHDSSITVTGTKTFTATTTTTTTFKNIKAAYVNGVYFDDYLSHLVLKNSPKHLDSITVQGTVTAPTVTAAVLILKGTIDGVDYRALLADAVSLLDDQAIQSSLVFMELVAVMGQVGAVTLNGLVLETDYFTTTTDQTIPIKVTFGDLATADVIVDGMVNTWYLPVEARVTMRAVGGQTVTGFVTLAGDIEVMKWVEVTGVTGGSLRVKLVEQTILLNTTAEIEALVIFTGPLVVGSLSTTTGIVNGVNLLDLYYNAWFVDEASQLSRKLVFQARIILKQGLVVVGEVDYLTVEELYRQTSAVLAQYSNKTEQVKKDYEIMCGPIIILHERLQSSIYEGDYFIAVGEIKLPYDRHSSTSFQAFNKTYVVMTWEGGLCDSMMYVFDPVTPQLMQVLIILNSGYSHQWLYLEGRDEVMLAMAGSPRGNTCTRNNSVIWRVREDSSVEVHQELPAAERVSTVLLGEGTQLLFLHTINHTLVYRFHVQTGFFIQIENVPGIVGLAATVSITGVRGVLFWAQGRSGKVAVNGVFGDVLEFPAHIVDGVMFQQAGKVFLVLSVVRDLCMGPQYDLELYAVDLNTKTVICVDSHRLAASATLLAFFAGNDACGSTIIIAVQLKVFPLVYKLFGEKLVVFSEECIPRVQWVLYLSTPGQRFPQLPDHYVLLGRDDQTILVTRLVMRGVALPPKQLNCDKEAFYDPYLTPHTYIGP